MLQYEPTNQALPRLIIQCYCYLPTSQIVPGQQEMVFVFFVLNDLYPAVFMTADVIIAGIRIIV